MANFIKLRSIIINSLKVSKIQIQTNKYYTYLLNPKIYGFFLFTSGSINTLNNNIDICKYKDINHKDYYILTAWLNSIH
jgi:hypothetical protein